MTTLDERHGEHGEGAHGGASPRSGGTLGSRVVPLDRPTASLPPIPPTEGGGLLVSDAAPRERSRLASAGVLREFRILRAAGVRGDAAVQLLQRAGRLERVIGSGRFGQVPGELAALGRFLGAAQRAGAIPPQAAAQFTSLVGPGLALLPSGRP